MKILIDIGHPAHVHYFKNFINIMIKRNHEFLIIAKNRNITHQLLDYYGIEYINRNDYPNSLIGKLFRIPITDLFMVIKSLYFKPDIMIGFSGTNISHAGFLLRIPSIILDDTDHAYLAHLSYKLFATKIITPKSFKKNFGKKHIKINTYSELFYLHKKYFKPKNEVLKLLNLKNNEDYVILRFVSWNASHDKGVKYLSNSEKKEIINYLNKKIKVFISSEYELDPEFKSYELKINPALIHDALYYSKFYIGEGGTTASEAAILGVPSIYINVLKMGYIDDEIKAGLLYQTINLRKIYKLIDNLLLANKNKYAIRAKKLLKDKIDPTDYLIKFIENYN